MKNASPKLQAAYVQFAHQVGRLLESRGATHDHGVYKLATPGGTLHLWTQRNWIFGRFANPVGGYIVTRGQSQEHSGRWATNFADDADTLAAESLLRGFEHDLDQMLGFELTDEQSQAIEREAEARARLAAIVDEDDRQQPPQHTMTALQRLAARSMTNTTSVLSRFRRDGNTTPRPVATPSRQ